MFDGPKPLRAGEPSEWEKIKRLYGIKAVVRASELDKVAEVMKHFATTNEPYRSVYRYKRGELDLIVFTSVAGLQPFHLESICKEWPGE